MHIGTHSEMNHGVTQNVDLSDKMGGQRALFLVTWVDPASLFDNSTASGSNLDLVHRDYSWNKNKRISERLTTAKRILGLGPDGNAKYDNVSYTIDPDIVQAFHQKLVAKTKSTKKRLPRGTVLGKEKEAPRTWIATFIFEGLPMPAQDFVNKDSAIGPQQICEATDIKWQ